MLEKVKDSFKELLSSLQTAKLYATEHLVFKKSLQKAYLSLQDILREREELVIGIVGEELAFEKEIFFELSKLVRPTIIYLKDRGMERIAFHRGIEIEELNKFIAFLVAPKEEVKKDIQEYFSLIGIKNITVSKLKASSAASEKPKEQTGTFSLYQESLDRVSKPLESFLDARTLDHLAVKFAINNLMENLVVQHQEFLKLTTLKRYDLGTFTHILNVSILTMHFSSKIGFAKDAVLDIGTAALFHDIGKLYISRKLITKAGKLTDEEFAQIKSHTVLGAELLLEHAGTLGILPVVVCLEHHLKCNLKGYPKLPFLKKPHLASMIVSICDVYDALSARRSYKTDFPPEAIYELMIKEKGDSFEPWLIDKFFAIMGVWPIGSIVSLTDGRIAVVIDENESDNMSPRVEIIHPVYKEEVIDLQQTKGSLKVERFLNPWKEGKDFLHLIGPSVAAKLS